MLLRIKIIGFLLIVEIYDYDIKHEQIIYNFKLIGSRPRVIFKKGKYNWYKIKNLNDIELEESSHMPIVDSVPSR